MSFVIATDTSANLPTPYTKEHGLVVIPLSYHVFGEEHFCMDTEEFNAKDADADFAAMKKGERVTTSQVPPQRYIAAFTPVLEAGNDVLFVGMSSGISGSYASSEIAAAQLRETFPERTIRTVDTLGASMGEGIPVMHAVEWRAEGLGRREGRDRHGARHPAAAQGQRPRRACCLRKNTRQKGGACGPCRALREACDGRGEAHRQRRLYRLQAGCGGTRGDDLQDRAAEKNDGPPV